MYESKVSTVRSDTWDNFSVMKNSNARLPGFDPIPCPTHSVNDCLDRIIP